MLVRHVTGLSDADLITNDDIALTATQKTQLDDYIAQRLKGRPVSKIIGRKEFYGRDFIVSDDVLDPRPDSEILIEVVLSHYKNRHEKIRILDLGTGSGCLILTCLAELPYATGVATDISCSALEIATQNAQNLEVYDRIEFIESNWFDSVVGQFDIIISNPPYIEAKDITTLDVDVQRYDPILALDGGYDGLNPYRVILPQIRTYLKQGGFMALEHGVGQSSRIKRIIENVGLSDVEVHFDYGARDRVLSAIHK